MFEMKHSDQLLQQAFSEGRSMTDSERHELREAYLWEQKEEGKIHDKIRESVSGFKDDINPLDLPRHRVLPKFPHMQECPICFKMRGYNPSILKEHNYMQDHPDDFCMKPQIHSEQNLAMFVQRERIDLDAKEV